MKKFTAGLLSLVLLLTMTACGTPAEDAGSPTETSSPTEALPEETTKAPEQTDAQEETTEPTGGSMDETMKTQIPGAPWQAQILRIPYRQAGQYPHFTLIRSREELEQYQGPGMNPKLKEQLQSYDEEFFETRFLVMAEIQEGSGSIRHKVTDVTMAQDHCLEITLETQIPQAGTSDMAQWLILLDLDRRYEVPSADRIRFGK